MKPDLHERIAKACNWNVSDVRSFSLATMREMVREKHPELAAEIASVIERGAHIYERSRR